MKSQTPVALEGRPTLDISPSRAAMGDRAAHHVIRIVQETVATRGSVRMMFACAPSQDEFLDALVRHSGNVVDWSRVTAFHMDEYVSLAADHSASFRNYLRIHLLDRLPQLRRFHLIGGDEHSPAHECARYAALLDEAPLDLICLGIGENGHIAFNDPPVADFNDVHSVKVVELDAPCRQQQVNDGCFGTFDQVPAHAITVTIPVFRRAHHLSVVVPGPRKASAVGATLRDPISTACPATVLRSHPNATLFLDRDSAVKVG